MITLYNVLLFGILLGGVYAVMAYGLGLIYGVMRIVNLAHGAVLMLAAYGAYSLNAAWGLGPATSLIIILPAAYVIGLLTHRCLVRRVVPGPPMAGLLLLFGVSLCARNLAYLIWTGDDRSLTVPYGLATVSLGVPVPLTKLVIFGASLTATAALFFLFHHSHFGRAVRAVSEDPDVAELNGIDVGEIAARAFGVGTALGALGGVLLSTIYVINPELGGPFLLKSFCIIVLGGMSSMTGILAGALTLGVAETAAGVYGTASSQDLVSFALLVLILVVRPGGLPSLVAR